MDERAVRVVAHARLHFGQLDLNGGLGRQFGSIGLAIERPRVVLEASPAAGFSAEGPDGERVEQAAARFYQTTGGSPAARIRVLESIPAHVGLGSGTQVALATGLALARLVRIELDTWQLARIMHRGKRSGIGIGAFAFGGFIVDGGIDNTSNGAAIPPILCRHPFPDDWWAVVAVPGGNQGMSGAAEDDAFAHAPPMDPERVGEICRLLVMQLLPSLMERDLRGFGAALTRIQELLGDYFATAQGGRFSTPLGKTLADLMFEAGASGVGQSSWGPTVYGLVQDEGTARALAGRLAGAVPPGEAAEILSVRAANTGAACVPVTGTGAAQMPAGWR